MSDKILDCSELSTYAYDGIKNGFKLFMKPGGGLKYFGYVDKRELKNLNREFRYTDKRSFMKGGLCAVGAYLVGKKVKEYIDKKKTVEEPVPEEES